MTCTLTCVGVSFLMKQTDYIALLLDALALIFIVEVAEVLYSQVLLPEIRAQTENIEPMYVPMFGIDYLNRRPALVDVIHLAAIILVTICWMTFYYQTTLAPLYDALQCTCLGVGKNCREAQTFSYEFWHRYWKEDIPNVFHELDILKSGNSPSSATDTAPAAPAPATTTLPAASPADAASTAF